MLLLDVDGALDRLVLAAAAKIEEQPGDFAGGKRVLVEPGVGRGGQLDADLRILQRDAVVARPGDFVLVRKVAVVAVLFHLRNLAAQRA